MRRYDDPVEVRRGPVPGSVGDGPEQFLWRGALWKVRAVLAHWVESAPWWQSEAVLGVVGSDAPVPASGAGPVDPWTEREWWRVRAGRGAHGSERDAGGVFDLTFDWSDGSWQLMGCED